MFIELLIILLFKSPGNDAQIKLIIEFESIINSH